MMGPIPVQVEPADHSKCWLYKPDENNPATWYWVTEPTDAHPVGVQCLRCNHKRSSK